MRARAPGKLVLSGAYAVLDGAPAIVTAVDRYVTADPARPPDLLTPEVRAALGPSLAAPWFDASELREGGEKLGLGSSAAIVVASLAARTLVERGRLSDGELAELVFEPALVAHRTAQGGGSGADVAAAAFGGTLVFHRAEVTAAGAGLPSVVRAALPPGLVIETWWSGRAASTADFVKRVRALGVREPRNYATLLGAQTRASEQAMRAVLTNDARQFVAALAAQRAALAALGRAAGAEIVTAEVERLADGAGEAAVLPAGAGGGDVVLHVAHEASTPSFRALAAEVGHRLVTLAVGARGVHVEGT